MAKDEATVRFNAETREFQNSIKDLNSAMSTLRSEAKLNESEFRATGDSVSYLEIKQKILEMQIEANSGFRSSGILTGNQTACLADLNKLKFRSSGILTGNQTPTRTIPAMPVFRSSGILTGNQT